MSSDFVDSMRAVDLVHQQERSERREANESVFHEAAYLANVAGMELKQHTNAHYSLRFDGWILNVYPGNQRLLRDVNQRGAPRLELPEPWDLTDVVLSVVSQQVEMREAVRERADNLIKRLEHI